MSTVSFDRQKSSFVMGIDSPERFRQWIQDQNHMNDSTLINQTVIGLAFVGRSNVGKSSLINKLFGNNLARTSKTPGRTREINIFKIHLKFEKEDKEQGAYENLPPFYLFDLPGYGHAQVSKSMSKNWTELIDQFFAEVPRTVCLINIQDGRHPHQKTDVQFLNYIKGFPGQVILTFNKMDKLKTQKERAQLEKQISALYKVYKFVKQIFFVSAESGAGIPELSQGLITFLLRSAQTLPQDREEQMSEECKES